MNVGYFGSTSSINMDLIHCTALKDKVYQNMILVWENIKYQLRSTVGRFQFCSFGLFRQLQAVALAIAVPEQFFLPRRLRLAVTILGATLSPLWTAFSVLQVGFLGSVWGCWTAPLSLSCSKETTDSDTDQATENKLKEHFFWWWATQRPR